MSNKNLFEMDNELAELVKSYHENADSMTKKQADEATAKIKALRDDISAKIATGAKPYKGTPAAGMKKKRGMFLVGMIGAGGPVAEGETPEEAVFNWNKGIYWEKDENESPIGKPSDADVLEEVQKTL